jgi:hypothetical protein
MQDVLVPEADLPRFFCIAYYENDRDFVNVSLMSFVTQTTEVAEVCRSIMQLMWYYMSYVTGVEQRPGASCR